MKIVHRACRTMGLKIKIVHTALGGQSGFQNRKLCTALGGQRGSKSKLCTALGGQRGSK